MNRAIRVRGTFVQTRSLGHLEILQDYLLGPSVHLLLASMSSYAGLTVTDSSGFITHFEAAQSVVSQATFNSALEPCVTLPTGRFIIPNFVDLHLHAPQFLYQGNGLHLPLLEWLNEYAFKAEERLDRDPALARKVYTRLARRLVQNGTGTVLLFGTIKEDTKYACLSPTLISHDWWWPQSHPGRSDASCWIEGILRKTLDGYLVATFLRGIFDANFA
jgi:guanine deaminase